MRVSRRFRMYRSFTHAWVPALAIAVALSVLLLEPPLANHFVRGHFNWVSMHSLAIAKHSYLGLGGVGYSCELIDASGATRFDYFNRYPLPFALLSRWLLNPWVDDPAAWLYAARQWMNLIFLAILGSLYLLVRSVGASRPAAVVAVLGTAGVEVVLDYKSMFHFDQPALLLYVVLITVSAKVLVERSWPPPCYYLVALFGIASGRSAILLFYLFSVLVVIASWLLLGPMLRFLPCQKKFFCGLSLSIAFRGFAVSMFALIVMTFYNVFIESRVNRLSFPEVSIVRSALRRLGLSVEGFEPRHLEKLSWGGKAVSKIVAHAGAFVSPALIAVAIVSVVMLIFLVAARGRGSLVLLTRRLRLGEGYCFVCASAFLASVLWLVGMKNLFVFHVYAGMVLLPVLCLSLAFFAELLLACSGSGSGFISIFVPALTVVGAIAFFGTNLIARRPAWLRAGSAEIEEMQVFFARVSHFNKNSSPQALVPYDPEWMPRSPYAQCALLHRPLWLGSHDSNSPDPRLTDLPGLSRRLR